MATIFNNKSVTRTAFTLLLVLAFLSIVSVILTSVALTSFQQSEQVVRQQEHFQTTALADSAQHVLLKRASEIIGELDALALESATELQLPLVLETTLSGQNCRFILHDENAKFNLNLISGNSLKQKSREVADELTRDSHHQSPPDFSPPVSTN